MTYASFKIRILASFIDGALNLLLVSILGYYVLHQITLPMTITALILSVIIMLNPLVVFYHVLFTHYLGGTPGKLLTGLRVVSENGKRLSFKRILFRQTIGYSFSWVFFGLGFYSIIKDEKKQGWHDKTVNSVVTARGNMLIIGLMLLILLYIAAGSLLISSFNSFAKSPVMKELQEMSQNDDPKPSIDSKM